MEATKKQFKTKSIANFMSNNAIILLSIVLALAVGLLKDNFFSVRNFLRIWW